MAEHEVAEPAPEAEPASAPQQQPHQQQQAQNDELRASLEETWYLKEISFRPNPDAAPKKFKIITQNYNG